MWRMIVSHTRGLLFFCLYDYVVERNSCFEPLNAARAPAWFAPGETPR